MKPRKRNRKPLLFMLSAILLCLSLTACSREDARAVIPKAQESIGKIDSISYDMVMNMEFSGNEAGQTMTMTAIASEDYILEPQQMYLTMNTNIDGLDTMDMAVYLTEDAGTYKTYTGIGKGSDLYWTVLEMEDIGAVERYNAPATLELYLSSAESFTENGKETISGTTTTRYDGVVSKDSLLDVIAASGILTQMEQLGLSPESTKMLQSMLSSLGDLPISIWIAEESYFPMKYEIDMTAIIQSLMTQTLIDMGEDASAVHVDNVSVTMTVSSINDVTEITIPAEALEAEQLSVTDNNQNNTEIDITEENYQSLFHVAEELGYRYVGCAYHKVPEEMFGQEAYVDAFLPYGEDLIYEDDGYTVQCAAHGMQVRQTVIASDKNAQDIVEEAYQALVSSGLDIYEDAVGETQYDAELNIACKQVAYYLENGTIPRITFLYADYKRNGYYLYAEITYFPEQMDADYPMMLAELNDAFGMTLPQFKPYR